MRTAGASAAGATEGTAKGRDGRRRFSSRGSRRRFAGGGALDVLGDDPTVRASSLECAELDATLLGDAASEGRGLDATSRRRRGTRLWRGGRCRGRRRGGRGRRCSRRGRGGSVERRGTDGCRLHLGRAGCRGRRCRRCEVARNGLPRLPDQRDQLAYGHLGALELDDLQQDAVGVGLDLLGDLLGVELVERLSLAHRVAFGLEPADDDAALHSLPEAGQRDLGCHQALASVRLTAAITSSSCGMTNCSMTGANGIGVKAEPTRSIGASR